MGSATKIEHDPGAEGPSGEGDAVIVKFCLMYLITIGVLVYEKFFRKREDEADKVQVTSDDAASKAEAGVEAGKKGEMTAEEQAEEDARADEVAQAKWTEPAADNVSDAFRAKFIKAASFGTHTVDSTGPVRDALYFLSGVNWIKVGLTIFVFFCLWVFLLTLSVMGTGFKLLGGKSSAKMFDVVDNPISALMVGILATVLVQSSSTSTSIIISLVGANELSVHVAVYMVMGANIGTSVTNTIVAMGHFANKNDLRRGFAAATVHDMFNWLSVLCILPINWMSGFLEKMTWEMAKNQKPCDEDAGDNCVKQEFIKPYISPYSKGVAKYDKNVAKYVSQGYCNGQCTTSLKSDQLKSISSLVCKTQTGTTAYDCSGVHSSYEGSWMSGDYLYKKRAPKFILTNANGTAAQYLLSCPEGRDCSSPVDFFNVNGTAPASVAADTLYSTCDSFKTGLCDKRLLKGGLMLEDWDLSDEAAGTTATILSLASLCCCLFLIVYCLQIIIKGPAARILRAVVGFNGYFSIAIGLVITILVQSSSITTSTLTPLCAVGLISLEDMYPLTLGANIGTTLTGIMAATVVASNPVEAWQVALCHFFFNIIGICIWYPVPKMREVPLKAARFLGRMTARFGAPFPLIYTFTVFFIIPAIAYGLTVAASS